MKSQVARVGHEDDDGPLCQENYPHGAENQAETDGGEPIHGPEQDAVDKELQEETGSEVFQHEGYSRVPK